MPEFHPSQVKLGKKPAKYDRRDLLFSNYLKSSALPSIPLSVHWGSGISLWKMFGNDALGDCTIAAIAHHEEVWTFKESGKEFITPEPDIIAAYSAVSGYIPGDENTDTGADMNTVLNYWKKAGVSGKKISSYAALEPTNHGHFMASVYLFGGCYIGLQMPITAQSQSKPNGVWSLVPGYQSNPEARVGTWGGHAVACVGFNSQSLCVISWGTTIYMTWAFADMYVDEAFAPLSPQWLSAANVAPNAFNLAQLQEDLTLIT